MLNSRDFSHQVETVEFTSISWIKSKENDFLSKNFSKTRKSYFVTVTVILQLLSFTNAIFIEFSVMARFSMAGKFLLFLSLFLYKATS